MFKNENSLSKIQMYSANSKFSRLFFTDQSNQSLNASQHPAIIFLRRENPILICSFKFDFIVWISFIMTIRSLYNNNFNTILYMPRYIF